MIWPRQDQGRSNRILSVVLVLTTALVVKVLLGMNNFGNRLARGLFRNGFTRTRGRPR